MDQEIHFCSTADGVSIAYGSAGNGPPLVKVANWMNHLEYDWRSPVWRHLLDEFTRDQQLVRYDVRGTGLSDRSAKDLSLEAFVNDLSSVIDATGLERFPLLAISQGGPVAIAYAVRNPEKVSHLILFGSFAAGWRVANLSDELRQTREAQMTLIRQAWHSKNPAIRQLWTTLCIPDATPEEARSFNELQRESATPEVAGRMFEAIGELDAKSLLPELKVPVLVLHSKGDAVVPFEEGRRLASLIPGAKFVSLESMNHLLLRHDPAWPVFVSEVRRFLGRETAPSPAAVTEQMKHCGTCGRVYGDPSLRYCLDDGTLLSPQPDIDPETVIRPETS